MDVADPVVENRGWMVEFGLFRHGEHEAHAATVEEGHLRRHCEEKAHAERVAVEGDRAAEVADGDGDLADAGELERGRHRSEERRVGKEWRSRRTRHGIKK